MSDVVIASSEADARAAAAVEAHHAEMSGALATLTEALLDAAARSELAAADRAREQLSAWCSEELLPHAAAEEEALYPAAGATTAGRLLVEAMLAEHRLIASLVGAVRDGGADGDGGAGRGAGLVRAAATATALRTVFESHLSKENEQILPLLVQSPGVSVAELLAGMHEILGGPAAAAADDAGGCGSGHTCGCDAAEESGHPELDARAIPHAIRHATIFGALETVRPGAGLVLVAPHDPLPLIAQVTERWPDRFTIEYLERGPETWRLAFVRD
ncbi:DUF2249 domain-containing protein [Isoptericola sp. b515]|uniref:DUF2249 domain-containing protein n=1 Tax=Isoptericola sp. b515 TaxID=3064652 RepID=UPI0027141CB0|nr:DUF2249 domain-containing protein [Isoptericola sp. b515]MDO8147487.1 DUF2249 domain-containing protein [Isoptericola sp. b515]